MYPNCLMIGFHGYPHNLIEMLKKQKLNINKSVQKNILSACFGLQAKCFDI